MTQQRKPRLSKPTRKKLVQHLLLSILGILPAIIIGIVELYFKPEELQPNQPINTIINGGINTDPGNDTHWNIDQTYIDKSHDFIGGDVNIGSNNQTSIVQGDIHNDFSKSFGINIGDVTLAFNDNDVTSNNDTRINSSDDDVYSNINQIPQTLINRSFNRNTAPQTLTESETIFSPELKKKDLE
ncbi:MAG: hypothetical protein AAFO04_19540 [Cyanobacteria bacterium J06592_8]